MQPSQCADLIEPTAHDCDDNVVAQEGDTIGWAVGCVARAANPDQEARGRPPKSLSFG
jgi:hypothetical protein